MYVTIICSESVVMILLLLYKLNFFDDHVKDTYGVSLQACNNRLSSRDLKCQFPFAIFSRIVHSPILCMTVVNNQDSDMIKGYVWGVPIYKPVIIDYVLGL